MTERSTVESDRYPAFVVTCDHRRGAEVVVARYVWVHARGVWEHAERSRVEVTYLEGNARGWWHVDADGELQTMGRSRVHHAIRCGECKVPPFRIDVDDLQTVFAVVAGNRKYRTQFTSRVSRRKVTLTLDQLAAAREAWNALRKIGTTSPDGGNQV